MTSRLRVARVEPHYEIPTDQRKEKFLLVRSMLEKPNNSMTTSRLPAIVWICWASAAVPSIGEESRFEIRSFPNLLALANK